MIKGLSDIRRFPRLGKIKLGIKTENDKGVEYPKAVDYFVCPDEVVKVYGEQPKELDIIFPVEDETIFFSQFYKRYGASTGLTCKGDGEVAHCVNKETGEMDEIECGGQDCEHYQAKACRQVACLQFLLSKVDGMGVWQIDTSSYHSIVNLNSAVDFIRSVIGKISMIPLKLIVKHQKTQKDGKKRTNFVLDLKTDIKLAQLQELATSKKLPPPPAAELPPPKEDVAPDDLMPVQNMHQRWVKMEDIIKRLELGEIVKDMIINYGVIKVSELTKGQFNELEQWVIEEEKGAKEKAMEFDGGETK